MQTLTRKQFTDFYNATLIEMGLGPDDNTDPRTWAAENGTDEAWTNIREGLHAHKPGTVGHYIAGQEICPEGYDEINDEQDVESFYRTATGDEMMVYGLGTGLIIVSANGGSHHEATDIEDYLAVPSNSDWEEYSEPTKDELYLKDDDDWKDWVHIDTQAWFDAGDYYDWSPERDRSHNDAVCVIERAAEKTVYAKHPPGANRLHVAEAYMENYDHNGIDGPVTFTIEFLNDDDSVYDTSTWTWENGKLR